MIIDAAEKRWLLIELLGDVDKKCQAVCVRAHAAAAAAAGAGSRQGAAMKSSRRIFHSVDINICDSHCR